MNGRRLLACVGVAIFCGALSEAAPVPPLAFAHVQTSAPVVALTFDCCQTQKPAGYDAVLVSLLVKNRIPATFFLGGRWIEAHPQAVKYLASIPFFELENHSYLHPHMTQVSLDRLRQELARPQQLLRAKAGRPARFLRPPYGEWDQRLVAEAARAGMQVVTFDVVTADPDKSMSVDELLANFRRARPGSVIIMHANGRGWKTAKALPAMLQWLQKKGLKPVTLSALVATGKPVPLTTPKGHSAKGRR